LATDNTYVIICAVKNEGSGFSAEVTRKVVGITYRQLDYWDKTGLIRPSIQKARGRGSRRVYAFEDLVELRVVARLLSIGVTLTAVRKAVSYLRTHFAKVSRPLSGLMLVVSGKSVLVKLSNEKTFLDATRDGQVVIGVAVAPIVNDLAAKVSDLRAPREVSIRVAKRTYTAVLTPDLETGGFTIEVPELPGVFSEADSIADARRMAKDAIVLWLGAASPRSIKRLAG
jgi:predicted RNase H-like HicB family nuclease/DNA-binding transcriptional MerR regulator